jgi:hypothetical protein
MTIAKLDLVHAENMAEFSFSLLLANLDPGGTNVNSVINETRNHILKKKAAALKALTNP